MQNNYVLGRGMVFFDQFAPGTQTLTGERYLGATASLGISAETQEISHYSSENGVRVKDASVTAQVDYTGATTVENMAADNIAMFFFGTSETATIASATGQTERFTAIPGLFYQLGMTPAKPEGVEQVSSVSIEKDPDGTPVALTAGTDYEVNLEEGYIEILKGGAVAADDVIEVTYNVAAQTQERVISGRDQIQGALRFRSRNAHGGQRNFYMPKVTLRPNGEYALKGDEFQSIAFSLDILKAGEQIENLFATGRGLTS
jgi:hypothetical protein